MFALVYVSFLRGLHTAGVPGGSVGDPRAYRYQFRGSKSPRVHARVVISYLVALKDCLAA